MYRSHPATYFSALGVALVCVLCLEILARVNSASKQHAIAESSRMLLQQLPLIRISGREIGNQTIAHNVALFATHPSPEKISEAYVGTSRTKPLRPNQQGESRTVNAAGNSYNEITYGLLLQADAIRQQFPHVKRLYVEASMLLRRPNRLIVEEDHRKYLPMLRELLPLGSDLAGFKVLESQLATEVLGISTFKRSLVLANQRQEWRLAKTNLFSESNEILVTQDPLIKQLDINGQQTQTLADSTEASRQPQAITLEHIKVQRMRDILSWSPWDGLFEMFALWGVKHSIEIVFFQPPVRSDLHRYQIQFGLEAHAKEMARVAQKYRLIFIDLNKTELGFTNDWELFSDEDHLATCRGISLLQSAIKTGYNLSKSTNTLFPQVDVRAATENLTGVDCNAGMKVSVTP